MRVESLSTPVSQPGHIAGFLSRKMEESRPEVNREKRKSSQLAERLEELRAALRLPQRDFAQGLGVSLRGYTEWMGGTKIPSSALDAAAARFGASPTWLVTGVGEMLLGKAESQPIHTAIMTGAGEVSPPPPGSHLDNLLQIQAGLAMALRENQRQIEAEIARLRTVRRGASGDPLQDQPVPPSTDRERP